MKKRRKYLNYFTKTEVCLWSISVLLITLSFIMFGTGEYITLAASLVGVTSLILTAKGNPVGQILMIAFSVMYGIISYSLMYYGEMITYLGMTAPMSLVALISWIKNPYMGKRSEVRVNTLSARNIVFAACLTCGVTVAFYFILSTVNTANIIPATVSVATSFIAVYLTFMRSEYFALAYAANDAVLIFLWSLAAIQDRSYLSVVICFAVFFANDVYGYISWQKMRKRQKADF